MTEQNTHEVSLADLDFGMMASSPYDDLVLSYGIAQGDAKLTVTRARYLFMLDELMRLNTELRGASLELHEAARKLRGALPNSDPDETLLLLAVAAYERIIELEQKLYNREPHEMGKNSADAAKWIGGEAGGAKAEPDPVPSWVENVLKLPYD